MLGERYRFLEAEAKKLLSLKDVFVCNIPQVSGHGFKPISIIAPGDIVGIAPGDGVEGNSIIALTEEWHAASKGGFLPIDPTRGRIVYGDKNGIVCENDDPQPIPKPNVFEFAALAPMPQGEGTVRSDEPTWMMDCATSAIARFNDLPEETKKEIRHGGPAAGRYCPCFPPEEILDGDNPQPIIVSAEE